MKYTILRILRGLSVTRKASFGLPQVKKFTAAHCKALESFISMCISQPRGRLLGATTSRISHCKMLQHTAILWKITLVCVFHTHGGRLLGTGVSCRSCWREFLKSQIATKCPVWNTYRELTSEKFSPETMTETERETEMFHLRAVWHRPEGTGRLLKKSTRYRIYTGKQL